MRLMTRRIYIFLITMLILTASAAVTGEAAVRVLKDQEYTTSAEAASKAAKTVKRGSHRVRLSSSGSGCGFLKFTADESRKYTFSFSKLSTKYPYNCGHVYLMSEAGTDGKTLKKTIVRTQGGKAESIYIATQKDAAGDKLTKHLKSRYAKVTLKKGQAIYIYFSFARGDSLRMTID